MKKKRKLLSASLAEELIFTFDNRLGEDILDLDRLHYTNIKQG